MKPIKQVISGALQANLAETRRQITIPDRHQALLDMAENFYGLHNRLEEFLREFHHPYTNHEDVIRLLRAICLNDLWFFREHDPAGQAMGLLLDIARDLLARRLPDAAAERLFSSLLEMAEQIQRTYADADRLAAILDRLTSLLEEYLPRYERVFTQASSFLRKLAPAVVDSAAFGPRYRRLTLEAMQRNWRYWHETVRLSDWYRRKAGLFSHDYAAELAAAEQRLFADTRARLDEVPDTQSYDGILDFADYANELRALINLFTTEPDRIYYIFHLLQVPGMAAQRHYLLFDLNRELRALRFDQQGLTLSSFLDTIFALFEELKAEHLGTVLDCILTLGKAVYKVYGKEHIKLFLDKVIQFGFVPPRFEGITDTWQARVDPNHLKCIRVWLELIELLPAASVKLIAALIVNLRTEGIFVADTDLFQKDVTQLLNAPIGPTYPFIKNLCRLFPVYFNEIGAEGELREITTALDESARRRDRLIHFLRKQVHTESNNTHLRLMEAILEFWSDGDPAELLPYLPNDIQEELTRYEPWLAPMQRMLGILRDAAGLEPHQVLRQPTDDLQRILQEQADVPADAAERLLNFIRLYQLLQQKYSLDERAILPLLRRHRSFSGSDVRRLEACLEEDDPEITLDYVYTLMERLKEVILDPQPSEGQEDIYYKRHIAAGIPSMYGQYREIKFESLGLFYRLEQLASRCLDELVLRTNITFITARNLQCVARILHYFKRGLELEEILSPDFQSTLEMLNFSLKTTTFSLDQFVNIFQFLARNLKDIICQFYMRPFEPILQISCRPSGGEPADRPTGETDGMHTYYRRSEQFYRDIIASSFILQRLDNFVSRILNILRSMVDNLQPPVIQSLMGFAPELISSALNSPTPEVDNRVFLGAKAYYLKKLYFYEFPIPPGFVLTTELFRLRNAIRQHPQMTEEIYDIIRRQLQQLEAVTGRGFGQPDNPLLLSVRSGTVISMPGAMHTFLNVGMNDDIAEEMGRHPRYAWTAWDCYRRLLQSWGMVKGIDRDLFDKTILAHKSRAGVPEKRLLNAGQMREIAFAYKRLLRDHGVYFEENPFQQLLQAIIDVNESWNGHRAQVYRRHLQIADLWGTAIIIQQMVLGNLDTESGTGVVFTNDPSGKGLGISLTGDFNICSQGEDVVSGLVHTLPVSENQRRNMPRPGDISLEKDFPEIYEELRQRARQLVYDHNFSHQEIEFTFESPRREDFYILQTRNYTGRSNDAQPIFMDKDIQRHQVGTGIGVGGGALNGIVVFDREDIQRFSDESPKQTLILIRPDTVPDDIGLIFHCEGLLTARGGATSHAAVTAVNLGKTCVVNCRDLEVYDDQKYCVINGNRFRPGDRLAIDGMLGNIFTGNHEISQEEMYGM